MGDTLSWAGRPKEGIPLIKEAISLNPSHEGYYQFFLGHAFYLAHRYSLALEALQASLNQNPDFFPSRIYLAAVYSEMDQMAFAKDEMDEVLKRLPLDSFDGLGQKLPYKDPKMLQRVLDTLTKVVGK